MRRKSARVAFLSLSLVATLALAQPQSTPIEAREPGVATAPAPQAGDRTAPPPRAHDDVDARACLDFLTNIGVIRCAEKYRHAHQRAAH